MIVYGGTTEQIERQRACEHRWHGPCTDNISRYYKCLKCYCLDRDVSTEAELKRALDIEGEDQHER